VLLRAGALTSGDGRRLRQRLLQSILSQDIAFFDAHRSGELLGRLTADVQDFKSSFKSMVSTGLKASTQIAGSAIALYAISPGAAAAGQPTPWRTPIGIAACSHGGCPADAPCRFDRGDGRHHPRSGHGRQVRRGPQRPRRPGADGSSRPTASSGAGCARSRGRRARRRTGLTSVRRRSSATSGRFARTPIRAAVAPGRSA
jgi:hypothetical protein